MSVLVDTSVWSLVFRRSSAATSMSSAIVEEMKQILSDGRALMMGPIRQELLSGIAHPGQFEALRGKLSAFPDLPIHTRDYEEAASFSNQCRRQGVQGSPIDLLICAVAARYRLHVFTTDKDFLRYSKIVQVKLHRTRSH